ncbi:MAG: hypothetical protein JSS66_08845 [Armatimonadetes bacterium]|nr:hypothetical protein [Armatimonadota bacterium]
MRDLWTCPRCGNRFVTANMAHSCGQFELAPLFSRSAPSVLETYVVFEELARSLAPVIVIPQKTRISFQTRTRFAGGIPKADHFDAGFIFFRRHPSPRFYKIEDYGKWFGHRLKLFRTEDVDDEVREFLLEALRYGDQAGPLQNSED